MPKVRPAPYTMPPPSQAISRGTDEPKEVEDKKVSSQHNPKCVLAISSLANRFHRCDSARSSLRFGTSVGGDAVIAFHPDPRAEPPESGAGTAVAGRHLSDDSLAFWLFGWILGLELFGEQSIFCWSHRMEKDVLQRGRYSNQL